MLAISTRARHRNEQMERELQSELEFEPAGGSITSCSHEISNSNLDPRTDLETKDEDDYDDEIDGDGWGVDGDGGDGGDGVGGSDGDSTVKNFRHVWLENTNFPCVLARRARPVTESRLRVRVFLM